MVNINASIPLQVAYSKYDRDDFFSDGCNGTDWFGQDAPFEIYRDDKATYIYDPLGFGGGGHGAGLGPHPTVFVKQNNGDVFRVPYGGAEKEEAVVYYVDKNDSAFVHSVLICAGQEQALVGNDNYDWGSLNSLHNPSIDVTWEHLHIRSVPNRGVLDRHGIDLDLDHNGYAIAVDRDDNWDPCYLRWYTMALSGGQCEAQSVASDILTKELERTDLTSEQRGVLTNTISLINDPMRPLWLDSAEALLQSKAEN